MKGFGEQQNSKKKSNKKTKRSIEEIINEAISLHEQGNILEAERYYKDIIKQGVKDHIVFSNYGAIYQQKGDLEKAIRLYRKAIEINPNHSNAYSNLGAIFRDIGKLEEAEIYSRKAIEINPYLANAHSNLGIILRELGKSNEAEESTRKAIEIQPDSSKDYFNLGNTLLDLGESKEAELSLRKAIELNPNYSTAYLNLGSLFRNIGKTQEAELYTRKAIELNPNLAEAHSNLGIILEDLGKSEEAEKVFLKAIQLHPNSSLSYLNLGALLFDLGRLEDAENAIKKAIELKPDLIKAYIKLGEILFEQDKPKEASICEWKAIELNPLFRSLNEYRDKARLINKTAFYIFNLTIFSHYKPIIEINPNSFEILVPEIIDNKTLQKIREQLNNKDIKIRYHSELLENKLLYEKLVSNNIHHTSEFIVIKNNIKITSSVPAIKLLGKKNINFMYTAGKNKTVFSYWNKYYDEILCFGPYHKEQFKRRHDLPIYQMGYPRFDKYFNPGFDINYLVKKFNCDPKKKTIVWLPTWTTLSSIDKYLEAISSLRSFHNTVVRPHPAMKKDDPDNYKKLLAAEFNYIDDNDGDNVELYALADLMIFDYGGSMFGSLYLNKNFAFLEMNLEAKNHIHLGKKSSEEYLKSFFPDRIASLETLKSICNYCLENPPSNSVTHSLRREFFNTNYQGNSAKRAYEILTQND